MTPEQLRASHLLLLAEDVDPDDVEALIHTRYPDAERDADGALRLSRHVTVSGPVPLDGVDTAAADIPPGWPSVYVLGCPVEREDPPMPGTSDPDGLHRAFADGMPTRAEARAVHLLVALARRLDGAVRVAGSGVVLRPDPAARVDLAVHAPYWLDPDTVLDVVRRDAPSARLAVEGQQWVGPPAGLVDAPGAEAGAELPADLRVALHASADRFDTAATQAPHVLDAYALVADVGPGGRQGLLEVMVHEQDEPVPALVGLEWADRAVTYEVRWSWPDERQAYLEHPSAEYLAARDVAATEVGLVAAALVEAADGVLVDSDGFLVDRYDL